MTRSRRLLFTTPFFLISTSHLSQFRLVNTSSPKPTQQLPSLWRSSLTSLQISHTRSRTASDLSYNGRRSFDTTNTFKVIVDGGDGRGCSVCSVDTAMGIFVHGSTG